MKIYGKMYKKWGFTLIEMVIVLIIMWILLMATMALSGSQIQKIKNKAIKESILAQWQSSYSRNLWSSSFGWMLYDKMEVSLSEWSDHIDFLYIPRDENDEQNLNSFIGNFNIKYIVKNYQSDNANLETISDIALEYKPYKMYCSIWWDEVDNLVLIMRISDNQDYCFEIQSKNCRLLEMSESKCDNLKNKLHVDDLILFDYINE